MYSICIKEVSKIKGNEKGFLADTCSTLAIETWHEKNFFIIIIMIYIPKHKDL